MNKHDDSWEELSDAEKFITVIIGVPILFIGFPMLVFSIIGLICGGPDDLFWYINW